MRLLVILSCVIAIQGAALNGTKEYVTINGVNYVKEVLKAGIDRPYLLAIDSITNTLYCSYSANDEDTIAKIDLSSKKFVRMNIKDGFSQTVDEKNRVVYFGTANGIYSYDLSDDGKTATVFLPDKDIWQVYFNELLYYSDYPNLNIYTLVDGVSKPFEYLKEMKVAHFCIDKDGDIFYDNSTGLFSQRRDDKNAVAYKPLVNRQEIRSITTDIHGNVFVCFDDGIYKVDKSRTALDKVLDVYDPFGLAFDNKNRMVYSESDSLVYLTPFAS